MNGIASSTHARVLGVSAFLLLMFSAGRLDAQERQVRVSSARLKELTRKASGPSAVPIITGQGVDSAAVSASGFQLAQGTFAALRIDDEVRRVPGPIAAPGTTEAASREPFQVLPFRYLTPDAAGSGTWVLRPIYKVASRLRWVPDSSVFRGAIFIAVEDSSRRAESRPLPTPVRFQLLAEADRVNPENIQLEHTNFPLQRIELVARSASDSLRVHIVPEFDVNGADIWVPVEPSLVVETTPQRIQGWGVGNARVIVRVIGASGRAPAFVSLSASEGELDTLDVAIGAAGTGVTRLRSGAAGLATLTATATGFTNAQATIEFAWPIAFFVAALLGGVFGGLAAAAQQRKGRRKARWGEFAVKGVFAGLLTALVWYALGVNLLQIDAGMPRFNELAVFAFAALAGYVGIPRIGAGSQEQERA